LVILGLRVPLDNEELLVVVAEGLQALKDLKALKDQLAESKDQLVYKDQRDHKDQQGYKVLPVIVFGLLCMDVVLLK
jgi:hypothetical protein